MRREISDDEGRIGGGRGSGSPLYSPPLLAFPRLSSILREAVRAAGAYSGICSEIYVRMERSRAVPRVSRLAPASSYHRFTTSPLTCANFRMRVSARQLSNPATPFFVASCTIDAIGKIVDFALNAMIYCRGNRAPSPSLKAKAQRGTTAIFKSTGYVREYLQN